MILRYFTKTSTNDEATPSSVPPHSETVEQNEVSFDSNDVVSDPGLRKQIDCFEVDIRDRIRREYICRGPCQPIGHNYPRKKMGADMRAFRDAWFECRAWLEYSIAKDAAFCFYCFLFRRSNVGYGGDDAFVKTGFSNWKRATCKFTEHVGGVNSFHNQARELFENFQNQRQTIVRAFASGKMVMDELYRKRLTASLQVVRFLLRQGLAFRGHDETCTSMNQGNFLELLDWLSANNEEVAKVVRSKAPGNSQMIAPSIQKQLSNCCAVETTMAILFELGDRLFSVMLDESRDCSVKEQMAVMIRFVDRRGQVIERFLGIVHVVETKAECLKEALDSLFSMYGLSLSRLRGQGYDGASNMRGEFNGLKTLVLKENPSAHYIHCFAHRLQLVVVSVCQSNKYVSDFFVYLGMIVTLCGSSCKRADMLRQAEHERLVARLENQEISTGKGRNQATSLCRPADTRWGTHFTTIERLVNMWPSVLTVLMAILEDGVSTARGSCQSLIKKMEKYYFVFIMFLMRRLLGATNVLSNLLQQNDQNIDNAVHQNNGLKIALQDLRDHGWESLVDEVNSFCEAYRIRVVDMEAYRARGSRFVGNEMVANSLFYRRDIFFSVIDGLRGEIDDRFSESTTELLSCISCLHPRDSFSSFDVNKLVRLGELYPEDFTTTELFSLRNELELFVQDLTRDTKFADIADLGQLSMKMVQTHKHLVFPLVYRLIELSLILPVATASVERVFSAMNIVKTRMRNKMGDQWMNDCLTVFIERDVFMSIDDESILQRFQNMDNRRHQLSRSTGKSAV